MGIGAGIFLIAIGAILTWAVKNPDDGTVNVNIVGVILMAAGLAGILASMLWWESWAGLGRWTRRRTPVAAAPPAAAPPVAAPPAATPVAVDPYAVPAVDAYGRPVAPPPAAPPPPADYPPPA